MKGVSALAATVTARLFHPSLGVAILALAAVLPVPAIAEPASGIATPAATPSELPAPVTAAPLATLPAGTPVLVAPVRDITSVTAHLGDVFQVAVVEDVVVDGVIVIPKGTPGRGEVTFASGNGSFGKSGILGITLHSLATGTTEIALEGHYREEGKSGANAAAAAMFVVGIFAAPIKGKIAVIPAGRVLRARTGADIHYSASASASATPPPAMPVAPVEASVQPDAQSVAGALAAPPKT